MSPAHVASLSTLRVGSRRHGAWLVEARHGHVGALDVCMDVVSVSEEATQGVKGVCLDTITAFHSKGPMRRPLIRKSASLDVTELTKPKL